MPVLRENKNSKSLSKWALAGVAQDSELFWVLKGQLFDSQ